MKIKFKQDPLPIDIKKFQKLSAKSFEIHYNNHHATYVKNLNKLVEENAIKIEDLEFLIKDVYVKMNDSVSIDVYNNAAQHFNHTFFWKSLSVEETKKSNQIEKFIKKSFINEKLFMAEFIKKGLSLFGSGWVWIVYNKISDKIEIMQGENAFTPIVYNHLIPLLVCDVWEHAYYVDFQNKRVDFLEAVYSYFNWNFASVTLENNISTLVK